MSLLSGAEDFLRAATVLSGARLESAAVSDGERARAYIRLAQNFLRGDDEVSAERYIRRAGDLVFTLGDRPLLRRRCDRSSRNAASFSCAFRRPSNSIMRLARTISRLS